MNKYSEMSDFEVNKLVAENLGYKYSCNDGQGAVLVEGVSSGYGGFKKIILSKNYCHEYSEAFKLMTDNKISLICREFSNKVEWHASKNGISAFNVSPCRAIAECFLLIKDEERGNEKAQKEV